MKNNSNVSIVFAAFSGIVEFCLDTRLDQEQNICRTPGKKISWKMLSCLGGQNWLTSDVIGAYMELLQERGA